MKKILLTIAVLVSPMILSIGLVSTAAYAADTNTAAVCEGVGYAGGTTDCSESGLTVNKVISNVINILSLIIGVVAVFMIMIAGFKFITANGDAGQVSSARNTILYAIVGLVVAALAQIIVKFVLSRVTAK